MLKNLLLIPVSAIRGAKEGEHQEDGVIVVLIESQDVHDYLLSIGGNGLLQLLICLRRTDFQQHPPM